MLNLDLHISIWWLLGVFGFFVLLIIGLNILTVVYASRHKKPPKCNIAVMSLTGIIMYGTKARSNFQMIISQLAAIEEVKPKALILRINSPGGAAGASHQIYQALQGLREKGIKVVTMMEDVAASGGVYVAMASDHIVATPGTITGSIGVIIKHLDFSAVFDRFNIRVNNIKSGPHKDMLSYSKPLDEEARALMQKTITDCYEAFCGIVADSRKLPVEDVKKFATGRIMSAKEAVECHLIDEVGGYQSAVKKAMELAAIPKGEETIKTIDPPMSLLERLGILASVNSVANQIEVAMSTAELSGVPLLLMEK